jgi:hypothetical protein
MIKIIKEKQIRDFTKKHPKWREVFLTWLAKDESIDIIELREAFSLLFKNKQLLSKEINVEFAKSLLDHKDETTRKMVEKFHDKIKKVLHHKNKNKFIKSLKTVSYVHLFNKDVEKEINVILDNNISIPVLKKQFFTKLARFDSAEALLLSLKSFRDKNITWSRNHYLNKIQEENLGVSIISDSGNSLLIHVHNHKACAALGSQAWCIVDDEGTFKDYTEGLCRQMIYCNFNLGIDDPESLIGLTVDRDGLVESSYLKDDSPTYQDTIDLFKFNKMDKKEIKVYLDTLDNQDAFTQVCIFGLDEYYDEYINKEGVDPSAYNNTIIIGILDSETNPIVERLLDDPRVDPTSFLKMKRSVHKKDVAKFKSYLKKGVNPSQYDNSILDLAARTGQIDVIKELLKNDDVQSADYLGGSVINAIRYGNIDVTKYLLKNIKKDMDASYPMFFIRSVIHGQLPLIKTFLKDSRIDPAAGDNKALIGSLLKKKYDIMDVLLKDPRVDPSAREHNVLRVLIQRSEMDQIRSLLNDSRIKNCTNKDELYGKKINFQNCTEDDEIEIKDLLTQNGFIDPRIKEEEVFAKQYRENIKNIKNGSLKL